MPKHVRIASLAFNDSLCVQFFLFQVYIEHFSLSNRAVVVIIRFAYRFEV